MKKQLTILVLLMLLLVACDSTTGSGDVITEERVVSGFDAVALTGIGTATIIQGDTESLTIEAEENIMPSITSEVENGTLILSQEEDTLINPTKPIKYTVTMVDISQLSASGSGGIDAASIDTSILKLDFTGSGGINVTTLDADSLETNIAGSGNVWVSGEVNDQMLSISGSGEYRAADLSSNIAELDVAGSGKAVVRVNDTLDVTVSGSALVSYYGNPIVTSSITGSGAIEPLEDE